MCACVCQHAPPADFAKLPTVSGREHGRVCVSVMIGEAEKCLHGTKASLFPLRTKDHVYVSAEFSL